MISTRSKRFARARRRRLLRRADPGQGRQYSARRLSRSARRRSAANTERCSSPTKFRPESAAPAASSRSITTGVEPDMVVARQGAFRRPCAGRRGAHAQMDFRQGLRPHGSRGRAWFDLRQERSRHGGRRRDARSAARTNGSSRMRPRRASVCSHAFQRMASATSSSPTCAARAS